MNKQNTWYQIRAEGQDPTAAEILIYGDIGESFWTETVTAKQFLEDLAALSADTITVRINSYGGSVPDGIAIHNAMRRHPAQITVAIDGTAYSIASLIAMAGDHVHMADNALMMIHAPWTYAAGNATELRETAEQLDRWAEAMTASYARRTGDADGARALLTDGKDHYYTAAEAVDAGLVDEVTEGVKLAAHALNKGALMARYREMAKISNAAAAAPFETSKEENAMNDETVKNKPAAQNNSADLDQAKAQAAAEALAADKQRRDDIARAFAGFTDRDGMQVLMRECQDNTAMTVQAAKDRLLAKLAVGVEPVAGQHVTTVEDEIDKRRAAAENALLARAGLVSMDSANPMRGYTLSEMARASAERCGVATAGRTNLEYVAAAFTHSTSDFPLLLGNVATKSLLKGYEEADETFQQWTSTGSLSDFKQGARVGLGPFQDLLEIPEGAEYKHGTIGDMSEPVVLATYGRLFSITRQAIINDDLDAFSRIPRLMGRAAVRTIGNLVYAVLTDNPKMADNTVLFHANHGNLIASGSAPSTAEIEAMRVKLASQKVNGVATNIRMKYLVVPPQLAGLARTVQLAQVAIDASGAPVLNTPNIAAGTFEVISDARLSGTAWYAVADPSSYDTVEVSYLNGQQTPWLETKNGWNVDGVEFKVRLDAGVKALDWRTMVKNAGA